MLYSQPREIMVVNRRMVSVALAAVRRNTLAFRPKRGGYCRAGDVVILDQSFWSLHQAYYTRLIFHFLLSASDLQLKAVHIETYGKTGCRRIVPGQYLAADPQGRAIMISAVEKQKLVRGYLEAQQRHHSIASSEMMPESKLLRRCRRNPRRVLPKADEGSCPLRFLVAPRLVQVYVLNRDSASRLAISSPLEAHKSNAIIFHTCGVDVGFDNPIFAVS